MAMHVTLSRLSNQVVPLIRLDISCEIHRRFTFTAAAWMERFRLSQCPVNDVRTVLRVLDTQVVHGNGTQTGETADGDSWWGSSTVNNQKRPQSVFGGEFESDPQQQDGTCFCCICRLFEGGFLRNKRSSVP